MATKNTTDGLLGALPSAAKRGAAQGGAMVAQDIMQDATRKLMIEVLKVDPEILRTNNAIVADLANVVIPALVNLAAQHAPDKIPGAKFLAAASEAAFTGRVSHTVYKHGSALTEMLKVIGPQLNELRKVGAELIGESLQPGDLQEVKEEEVVRVSKGSAAS